MLEKRQYELQQLPLPLALRDLGSPPNELLQPNQLFGYRIKC